MSAPIPYQQYHHKSSEISSHPPSPHVVLVWPVLEIKKRTCSHYFDESSANWEGFRGGYDVKEKRPLLSTSSSRRLLQQTRDGLPSIGGCAEDFHNSSFEMAFLTPVRPLSIPSDYGSCDKKGRTNCIQQEIAVFEIGSSRCCPRFYLFFETSILT